jgi:ATP-dependent Lon protease
MADTDPDDPDYMPDDEFDDKSADKSNSDADAEDDADADDEDADADDDDDDDDKEDDDEADDDDDADDEEEEDDEEEDEEADEEEGEIDLPASMNGQGAGAGQIVVYLSAAPPSAAHRRKRQKLENNEETFVNKLNNTEWQYWDTLSQDVKKDMLSASNIVQSTASRETVPLRFRILQSNMDPNTKRIVLSKIDHFNAMREGSGEYNKLRGWLNAVSRLPLGIYKEMPVKPSDPHENIVQFIQSARNILDETVYGHTEVKDHIMRIMAQWVSNPSSKGHVIGLQGLPGVGKTLIVKSGIAKALNLPFAFVALGGASDGSFLEGHGFTYEGSTYGKIADILMKAGTLNPVIFFDELDKVSTSSRGEEIIGILTHLTDPSQNERFCDRYFSELELDLSKALIIFSYNDESLINPILKDRMITINVPGYTKTERLVIARDYLLPEILAQYNLKAEDVVIDNSVLQTIVHAMPSDRCGVRNLKRALESIVSWMNMNRFMPDKQSGKLVTLPIKITEQEVEKYMKVDTNETCPLDYMYI